MKISARTIYAFFALIMLSGMAHAAVSVTKATGGSVILSNTAPGCSAAGTWYALANPKFAENAAGEIGTGDIVFSAPAGFEFDTAAAVTVTLTGNATASKNINGIATGSVVPVSSVTTSAITFTVTKKSASKNTLLWTGIQVRPTASFPLASGNITHTGTSTINNVTATTNLGTLTETQSVPACSLTAPTVASGAATALSTTGATLNGTVSSNGAITVVSFDYGVTTAYGSTATATPSPLAVSAVNTAVSAAITGLGCGTTYHFRVTGANSVGTSNSSDSTFSTSVCPAPVVTSINTASNNPTSANTNVSWTIVFDMAVTGVDLSDFALISAGSVTGASLSSVAGNGTTYTVTANTGTGTVGSLTLKLVDNDSIVNASATPLGGAGAGNGDFTGQPYTLIVPVCSSGMLFCDDFERTVAVGGSNAATQVGTAPGYGAWVVAGLNGGALSTTCNGAAGNAGCAGIDSDVPPWSTTTSLRANSTRAMFTRWSSVTVTSPVINLAGKTGARLSFWLRRGSDCFSEWPGNNQAGCGAALAAYTSTPGEEFQVQYLNNLNVWVALAQYPTDDTPGEVLAPSIDLPDDALWSGFKIRFLQPNGSGSGGNGGAAGVVGYDYWHVDNVVLIEVPAVTFTGPFCDTFEGNLSRWGMLGTGNVRIGSTHFANGLHNMDLRWNAVSATSKSTDLSTNSGNNQISFWVKRGTGAVTTVPNTTGSDFPETAAKGLKFEYLNNAGAWIQLSTFPGAGTQGQIFSAATSPATNSFTLPADAKHSRFRLRISMLAGSGLLDQDYWHVDDVCVGSTVGSTDLGMSMTSSGTFSPGNYVSYTMTVTNLGPNDDPGPVTITDTLPAGLTYAGGSAGWTCSAAGQTVTCIQTGILAVGASTSLTVTATVDATASAGVITNTAYVGGGANDAVLANNTATHSDTIFIPGYVFVNKPCALNGVAVGAGSQCAPVTWSPQTAGTPQANVYIAAVNGANVPIQLNAANPVTVNMQFALSCVNPVADAGIQATFSASTLPLCEANGAMPATWSTGVDLIFAAGTPSAGPFSFNYDDVGSIELFVRNSQVTTQQGRSGIFVVKPASFLLTHIKCTTVDTANCGTGALAKSGENPKAATADGATFIRAGHPFSVTVMALNSTGNRTPNYGHEISPEGVRLTPALVLPATGNNPAVSGTFGAFGVSTNGEATGSAFTWSEAGIITLTPSVADRNYLGAGDVTGTPSENIGRFYAAKFGLSGNSITNRSDLCPAATACPSAFTYMNEQINAVFTLTAEATDGTRLQNYTDSFAKFDPVAGALNLGVIDNSPVRTPLSGRISTAGLPAATGQFLSGCTPSPACLGTANVTAPFMITRGAGADGPYSALDIGINPVDSDGAVLAYDLDTVMAGAPNHARIGRTEVRHGRLNMTNAYGSGLLNLTLPLTVQYWNGTAYVTNTGDSISQANISLSNPNAWTTNIAVSPVTFAQGQGDILLSAPGGDNSGNVEVTASAYSYLPSSSARATFGVYGEKNVFIYHGRHGR
ncbi:MAG: hypothetical protein PHP85_11760 [Gallionella sp.]|nr:hypothetical protein [Gallionella sp.]